MLTNVNYETSYTNHSRLYLCSRSYGLRVEGTGVPEVNLMSGHALTRPSTITIMSIGV